MGNRDVTRLALLRAAEKLFAERGVDNVSLREVAAAAAQRNHSAVLYHFGDKRNLLEAMLERHSGPVDQAIIEGVAQLQREGTESVETLVSLLVRPMLSILDTEGGPEYVSVCSELVTSRTYPITSMRAANGPGASELSLRLLEHTEIPPLLMPLRMMRTAAVLFTSIAQYHRLLSAGMFIPRDEFAEDLIDSMVAVVRPRPLARR